MQQLQIKTIYRDNSKAILGGAKQPMQETDSERTIRMPKKGYLKHAYIHAWFKLAYCHKGR